MQTYIVSTYKTTLLLPQGTFNIKNVLFYQMPETKHSGSNQNFSPKELEMWN